MKFQTSSVRQNSFSEMNLSPALMKALEKMSIKKPTPIQAQGIPVVAAGADLIGIAQTGSGKTLAYALSVLAGLERKPTSRALVLAPSREMAQQIYKVFLDLCHELPMSVCLAIGGTTGSKQENQLKKNPKLIIATPGRMNDHLQKNKLLLKDVEYVVIDEADRMLDMGFAPQLKTIQATLRGQRQTLMFSASFGHNVDLIAQLFLHPKAVMVRSEQAESPVESLKQKVLFMDRSMKNDRLLDELNATRGGVIVFTGNQETCESVGEYLQSYGFESDLIHGGLSQGQRNRVVRAFRDGEIRIVVATDLLARGLDVPHVDHVVNYDLPFQAEDFLHRIGRTARAGRNGEAITFVTPSDHRMYAKVKQYLQGAKEETLDPSFKFIDRSKRFAKSSEGGKGSGSGKAIRPGSKGGKPASLSGRASGKKPVGKSAINPFKKRR